jgi:hypothetical protein
LQSHRTSSAYWAWRRVLPLLVVLASMAGLLLQPPGLAGLAGIRAPDGPAFDIAGGPDQAALTPKAAIEVKSSTKKRPAAHSSASSDPALEAPDAVLLANHAGKPGRRLTAPLGVVIAPPIEAQPRAPPSRAI